MDYFEEKFNKIKMEKIAAALPLAMAGMALVPLTIAGATTLTLVPTRFGSALGKGVNTAIDDISSSDMEELLLAKKLNDLKQDTNALDTEKMNKLISALYKAQKSKIKEQSLPESVSI